MEGEHYRSPCLYSPKCLEKLSEKPRRGLQRALRVAKEGAFWSISPSLHRPDSPSECSLCPFSDSLRRSVLGSSHGRSPLGRGLAGGVRTAPVHHSRTPEPHIG
jgi:hypothetical protein